MGPFYTKWLQTLYGRSIDTFISRPFLVICQEVCACCHSSSIFCFHPPIRACATSLPSLPPKQALNPNLPSNVHPWRWRRSWALGRGCWGWRWWTATRRTPICPAASTLLIWWLWALAAHWVLASTCLLVPLHEWIQVRLATANSSVSILVIIQKELSSSPERNGN